MSKEAIQEMVRELEALPESDQRLVLAFLVRLRRNPQTREISAGPKPSALQKQNGLLAFTGQLEQPDANWVQLTREEQDHELMNFALRRI
jgi:hypothetical protein